MGAADRGRLKAASLAPVPCRRSGAVLTGPAAGQLCNTDRSYISSDCGKETETTPNKRAGQTAQIDDHAVD